MKSHWLFCPKCGAKLEDMEIPPGLWLVSMKCTGSLCGQRYLEVLDMRNIYSICPVYPNIPELLNTAPKETLEKAISAISVVDYKTVSLVEFERVLLGVDAGR